MTLMNGMHNAIIKNQFPEFVFGFLKNQYPAGDIPGWAVEAFKSVRLDVKEFSILPDMRN